MPAEPTDHDPWAFGRATGGSNTADRLFDRWTVLTLLCAGALLFWGAGHYTVFDDEALSCRLYAMPAAQMVAALWNGQDPDPPLYYILVNAWIRLFGVGPLGLRSLSILLFLAGLVFVRSAGQAWFDRRTGLVAMVLCALHPAHLFFGFAARWYSLMFLMVAILLRQTGRLVRARPDRPGRLIGWILTAAAACYTNYFALVVVGLILFAVAWRQRPVMVRRWLLAGLGVLVLYAVWIRPLWIQLAQFPRFGFELQTLAATAARTTLVLLVGNLASVGAWWAWAPMALFGFCCVVLLTRHWRFVWPIGVVVLGCFTAGVASRSMIDKYILTFSGPACLLAAALLVRDRAVCRPRGLVSTGRLAVAALSIGWIGCGVNLLTQRYWSSLRWLDPFEQAIDDLASRADSPPPANWVMTHPAARYYYARHFAASRSAELATAPWRIAPDRWRRFAYPPDLDFGNEDVACATPASILERLEGGPLPSLVTVEAAGFAEGTEAWRELLEVLDRSFVVADTWRYLQDPDAAWKDRVDPRYSHPRWRIVVRRWVSRGHGSENGNR